MRRFLGRLGHLIGRGLVSRGLGGPAATAPPPEAPSTIGIQDGYATSIVMADDYAASIEASFGYACDIDLTSTAP